MKKTYSTTEAARRIGVHVVTLKRWLARGKIRPSVAVAMNGRTLWRFTARDVARFRRFGAALRPGPKVKRKK
jgi:excisionase family DNA binding protein